jgi:uncharacterized membrane protein
MSQVPGSSEHTPATPASGADGRRERPIIPPIVHPPTTVNRTRGIDEAAEEDFRIMCRVVPAVSRTGLGWGRAIGRVVLGGFLLFAGLGHLLWLRQEFQAQVPDWVPLDADLVVVLSGIVEVVLGLALLLAPRRHRALVGWVVAAFFVAVFPGNISQWITGTDAFGLDTDRARFIRLFFQPVLIAWALWCSGAWQAWQAWRRRREVRE